MIYRQGNSHTNNPSPAPGGQRYAEEEFPALSSTTNPRGPSTLPNSAPTFAAAAAGGYTGRGTAGGVPLSGEAEFGLLGMLELINTRNKDLAMLACGTDLTTFGLNLNSAEPLSQKFVSPFTDIQGDIPPPPFRLPACYPISPPVMNEERLTKFQLETLFYLFHFYAGNDMVRMAVAIELYRRDWKYAPPLQKWMKLSANASAAATAGDTGGPGSQAALNSMNGMGAVAAAALAANVEWIRFDVDKWEFVPLEREIDLKGGAVFAKIDDFRYK